MSVYTSNLSVDLSLREEFFQETQFLLKRLDEIIFEVESTIKSDYYFDEAFRIIHNIKGGSMSLGIDKLSDISHRAEDQLLKSNNGFLNILVEFKLKSIAIINEQQNLFNKQLPKNRNLNSIFAKLYRVVTSTSRELGKYIEFNINDIAMVLPSEKIVLIESSLMHILRNACDHGFANKLTKEFIASIDVSIFKESDHLVIEVTDNGVGVDCEKVLSKAKDLGIQSQHLSLDVIFSPHFTTKEIPSTISGRGIGLDVVKENLSALGGSVTVKSLKGEGTTFRMTIPLSDNVLAA